jgi:dUTP pyrophosphatase
MFLPFIKQDWAGTPSKGSLHSAGIDLFISIEAERFDLYPGRMVAFSTGLKLAIPEGYFGLLQSRSSAFRNGLWIHGVIDADYRGDIVLQIRNIGADVFTIEPGKSYAQLIILPFADMELQEVKELNETIRGEGGFGSSGNT